MLKLSRCWCLSFSASFFKSLVADASLEEMKAKEMKAKEASDAKAEAEARRQAAAQKAGQEAAEKATNTAQKVLHVL